MSSAGHITVFVEYSLDTDRHELWVSGPGMGAMPAGPRLFRVRPYPDVQFSHIHQREAEEHAARLRNYIASVTAKKPSKKQMAEMAD